MSDNNIGNDVPMHEPTPGKSAWDEFDNAGLTEQSAAPQEPKDESSVEEGAAIPEASPDVGHDETDDGVYDPGPDLREFPPNATVELPLFKDVGEKQKKAITSADSINLLS